MYILIIEDDHSCRETLQMLVESLGHSTVCASGPEEAYRQLRARSCDLVLVDYLLGGATGVDVFRMIRDELRLSVPIAILSALADAEQRVAIHCPGALFLFKPFGLAELRGLLDQV